jgi:hypothetical protein
MVTCKIHAATYPGGVVALKTIISDRKKTEQNNRQAVWEGFYSVL